MSTERKLAWIGLLVGLVGLVPALREANAAVYVPCMLFVLVIGGYPPLRTRRSR